MDKRKLLRIIKAARALLEKHYVKWTTDDLNGGHCSIGCLKLAQGLEPFAARWRGAICEYLPRTPAECFIIDTARRLHPELAGRSARRLAGWGRDGSRKIDSFDRNPAVFVNNHLGKEAILAVYDAAIADLETDIAVEDLCAAEAECEPEHSRA